MLSAPAKTRPTRVRNEFGIITTGTEPISEQELARWIRKGPPARSGFVNITRAVREDLQKFICEQSRPISETDHAITADVDFGPSLRDPPINVNGTLGLSCEEDLTMLPSQFEKGNRNAEWEGLFAKLESFGQLEDGWNSYSAKRPTETAVENARQFLDVLCVANLKPNRVGSSAVGGVGVTFRRLDRKSYVECLNAGETFVLFSDGIGDPLVERVSSGYRGFLQLVGEIRNYLNA
jgi:hypothetical protein